MLMGAWTQQADRLPSSSQRTFAHSARNIDTMGVLRSRIRVAINSFSVILNSAVPCLNSAVQSIARVRAWRSRSSDKSSSTHNVRVFQDNYSLQSGCVSPFLPPNLAVEYTELQQVGSIPFWSEDLYRRYSRARLTPLALLAEAPIVGAQISDATSEAESCKGLAERHCCHRRPPCLLGKDVGFSNQLVPFDLWAVLSRPVPLNHV